MAGSGLDVVSRILSEKYSFSQASSFGTTSSVGGIGSCFGCSGSWQSLIAGRSALLAGSAFEGKMSTPATTNMLSMSACPEVKAAHEWCRERACHHQLHVVNAYASLPGAWS